MSLGPRLREEQILGSTRELAYFPKLEREILAQPINKRARIRKDPFLPAHQTAADDSRPKDFQCNSCEKGFIRQTDLRRHEKIHSPGEFYCTYPGCEGCFKRKDHLNNHIRKKHGNLSYSAPQMPVLRNDNPDNDPDSGKYSSLGHFSDGAWNFQGDNFWQSSQSGSNSRNSGGLAPSGSSFIGHGFEASLEEICRILEHKSGTEFLKMFTGGKFLKMLGRGSFGSVYEVSLSHGVNLDRRSFACKIIRLPRHRRNEATKRALNEIIIVRFLDHPNIIKFAGAWVLDDLLFMNSIPVADSNLNQFLSEPPPLESRVSGQQIWKSVDGLASALAYLHNEQIVHFDLKPSNILVRKNTDLTTCTQFILADFGSSQILVESQMEFIDHAVTPRYCAPEWFEDKGKRGSHCDIFSFGCILAEIHAWTKSRIPRDYEAFRIRRMGFKRNWTYYESLPALNDWFHLLSLHESTGRSDYTSLVMKMLRPNYQERPSAAEVVATLDLITENKARQPDNGICDYIRPQFFLPSKKDFLLPSTMDVLLVIYWDPLFLYGKSGAVKTILKLDEIVRVHNLDAQERWHNEEQYWTLLALRKKKFGPDHPLTLHTAFELGKLYCIQCKLDNVHPGYKDIFGSGFKADYARMPQSLEANWHDAVVRLRLDNPDSKIDNDNNPLVWAASNGDYAVVNLLLIAQDVIDPVRLDNPDFKIDNGSTPLHWASRQGHEALINRLLGLENSDSKINNNNTALVSAAENGHYAVVDLLLGLDISDTKIDNHNMISAAENGHYELVEWLLVLYTDSKIDNDYTALESEVRQGHYAVIKLPLAQLETRTFGLDIEIYVRGKVESLISEEGPVLEDLSPKDMIT